MVISCSGGAATDWGNTGIYFVLVCGGGRGRGIICRLAVAGDVHSFLLVVA